MLLAAAHVCIGLKMESEIASLHRVHHLLQIKDITADNLKEAARFLTGPCTCKVKEQNPGVDLLVLADWLATPGKQPVLTLTTEASSNAMN